MKDNIYGIRKKRGLQPEGAKNLLSKLSDVFILNAIKVCGFKAENSSQLHSVYTIL